MRFYCQEFQHSGKHVSVRLEAWEDDRAYQLQMINSYRLIGCPMLEGETERTPHVMIEPQWRDMIWESQEVASLRARIEAVYNSNM